MAPLSSGFGSIRWRATLAHDCLTRERSLVRTPAAPIVVKPRRSAADPAGEDRHGVAVLRSGVNRSVVRAYGDGVGVGKSAPTRDSRRSRELPESAGSAAAAEYGDVRPADCVGATTVSADRDLPDESEPTRCPAAPLATLAHASGSTAQSYERASPRIAPECRDAAETDSNGGAATGRRADVEMALIRTERDRVRFLPEATDARTASPVHAVASTRASGSASAEARYQIRPCR
jgi:hypothetical protein